MLRSAEAVRWVMRAPRRAASVRRAVLFWVRVLARGARPRPPGGQVLFCDQDVYIQADEGRSGEHSLARSATFCMPNTSLSTGSPRPLAADADALGRSGVAGGEAWLVEHEIRRRLVGRVDG